MPPRSRGFFACFKAQDPHELEQSPDQGPKLSSVHDGPHGGSTRAGSVSLPCLHLEGQSASSITHTASLSFSDASSEGHHADVPRIICRLRSALHNLAGSTSSHQPSSSPLLLSLHHAGAPAASRFANEAKAHPARQRGDSGRPWLHVEPVCANASARNAWGCTELASFARAFAALGRADDAFLATLSEVALSVAAPFGIAGSVCAASTSKTYMPNSRQHVPGGASLRVSSSYVRDPDDGTLTPALVLELENVDLRQLSSPLVPRMVSNLQRGERPPLSFSAGLGPHPSGQSAHDGGTSAMVARVPSASAKVLSKTEIQHKRNLLRSSAMISAVPCIATLLELHPVQDGVMMSDDFRSSSETVRATGRILLQNELSVQYWGKMMSRGDELGSWELLVRLFETEPDAIQGLLEQLQEQREALAAGQQRAVNPWKKVVQVPSTCHLGPVSHHGRRSRGQSRQASSNARQQRVASGTDSTDVESELQGPSRTGSNASMQLDSPQHESPTQGGGGGGGGGAHAPPRQLRNSSKGPGGGPVGSGESLLHFMPTSPGGGMSEAGNAQRPPLHSQLSQQMLGTTPRMSEGQIGAGSQRTLSTRPSQMGHSDDQQQQLRFAGMSVHPSNRVLSMLSRLDHSSQMHEPKGAGLNSHGGSGGGGGHVSSSSHSAQLSVVPRSHSTTTRPTVSARQIALQQPLGFGRHSKERPRMDLQPSVPRPRSQLTTVLSESQPAGDTSPSSAPVNAYFDGTSSSHSGGAAATAAQLSQPHPHPHVHPHPHPHHLPTHGPGHHLAQLLAVHGPSDGQQAATAAGSSDGVVTSPRRGPNRLIASSLARASDTSATPVPPPAALVRTAPAGAGAVAEAAPVEPPGRAAPTPFGVRGPQPFGARASGPSGTSGAFAPSSPTAASRLASKRSLGAAAEASLSRDATGAVPVLWRVSAPHGYGAAVEENGTSGQVVLAALEAKHQSLSGQQPQRPPHVASSSGAAAPLQNGRAGAGGSGGSSNGGAPHGQPQAGHQQQLMARNGGVPAEGMRRPPLPPQQQQQQQQQSTTNNALLLSQVDIESVSQSEHSDGGGEGEGEGQYESEGEGQYGEDDEGSQYDDEEAEEDEGMRYHEVQALTVTDPVTGKEAMLLLQTDITARALLEKRMSTLTETQLTMLENMYPRQVLEFAMSGSGPNTNLGSLAYEHSDVTVLFMDIVGFTSMSKEVQPQLVMQFLNNMFSKLDDLCDFYNVYKVDTAGDCYIVAGALMKIDEDGFIAFDQDADMHEGAKNVVDFAQAIMRHARIVRMPHNGNPASVRVGIHTGSVVSGLVGTKLLKFSLFGDTMNTSSRMESTSRPGCIQISSVTYEVLDDAQKALFRPTGGVQVKGKGLMATYINEPREEDLELRPEDLAVIDEGTESDERSTFQQQQQQYMLRGGSLDSDLMQLRPDLLGTYQTEIESSGANGGEHPDDRMHLHSHGVLVGGYSADSEPRERSDDGAGASRSPAVRVLGGPPPRELAAARRSEESAGAASTDDSCTGLSACAARRRSEDDSGGGSDSQQRERGLLHVDSSGRMRAPMLLRGESDRYSGSGTGPTSSAAVGTPAGRSSTHRVSRPSTRPSTTRGSDIGSNEYLSVTQAVAAVGSPRQMANNVASWLGAVRRRGTASGTGPEAAGTSGVEAAAGSPEGGMVIASPRMPNARAMRRNSASATSFPPEMLAQMAAGGGLLPPRYPRGAAGSLGGDGPGGSGGPLSPSLNQGQGRVGPCTDLFMAAAAVMSHGMQTNMQQSEGALNKLRKLRPSPTTASLSAGAANSRTLSGPSMRPAAGFGGRVSPGGTRPATSAPTKQ